jgi:hypothetical protein
MMDAFAAATAATMAASRLVDMTKRCCGVQVKAMQVDAFAASELPPHRTARSDLMMLACFAFALD